MTTIHIPTPLRQYVNGQAQIQVNAPTVKGALDALTLERPELRKHLFTPEGKVRAFVNVYLNDEDVRYLPQKEDTAVTGVDTLSIIPSIAGGGLAVQAFGLRPMKSHSGVEDGDERES